MTGKKLLFAVSLLLLALAPAGAVAADVKAHSSTQYLWYNDPFQDKTQGDILQDVKPSATKIDGIYFLYMSSDPGAYAHNYWYAAQLLYDSLDELADGVLT